MRTRLVIVLGVLLLTAGAAAPAAAHTGTTSAPDSTNPTTFHSTNATPLHSTNTANATNTSCSFPFTTTDATGTRVTVPHEPRRVVTLNPSAAQIMWEIGAKSKVVGVSQYAAYLDGASTRTNISGAGNAYVDEENVINLQPDLVLAPNTIPNSTVQKLRQANLTVYRYPAAVSMTDIENQTRLTGKLAGECTGAQRTASRMQSQLATIRTAVNGTTRPRVLYTFYGYTAGKGTFIDQIITTAGGDNVAADAGISGYKPINKETIINRNPQWIVRNDGQPSVPHDQAYNSTDAVKHGNVIVLNRNYINEPAPRVVQPITKLAKALHPAAYATANGSETGSNASTTVTNTTATQRTTTSASTSSQETTSGSTPGFGAGVALVGILGALAVAAMRKGD